MEENFSPAPKYEPPAPAPAVRLDFDRRDKILLPAALLSAYVFQELLRGIFSSGGRPPALGALVTALLFFGLLVWYAREKKPLKKACLPLLIPALLVTGSLGLYAQGPLSTLNLLAAPALLFLWALCACGILPEPARWTLPVRAFLMSYVIRWKHVDKPVRVLASLFRKKSLVWLWVLAGLGVSLFLILLLILPLLRAADGVFGAMTHHFWLRLQEGLWARYLLRLFVSLCLAFLVYSALYALRHDGPRPLGKDIQGHLPPALSLTVLVCVDLIYLVFSWVQFAYLFGGAEQLALSGLSYAEYARSGFFQLVFAAVLNLGLSMLATQLTAQPGKNERLALRILSALLLGMTAVLLASAAYRMAMYISAYGLSILRAMTLWGMGLIALWLVFAYVKLFRPQTRLFSLLFHSAIIAWALLSLCGLNGLVARGNAALYRSGVLEDRDPIYMIDLGPAALPAVEDLLAQPGLKDDPALLSARRTLLHQAREVCGDWRSWNVEAALFCGRECEA